MVDNTKEKVTVMRVRKELKRIFKASGIRVSKDHEFHYTGISIDSSNIFKQFIVSNLIRPDK